MVTQEERKKALAEYLDIYIEDVEDSSYNDSIFETSYGDYLVCTYDEAYELAVEDIKGCMDELGFDCFTESFREHIVDAYVDKKNLADIVYYDLYFGLFDDLSEDELKDYCEYLDVLYEGEDTIKDDLVSSYMEKYGYDDDPVEYYRDFMTEKELYMFLQDNGYLDEDGICDEAIEFDGIAHFIASYDGEEIELNDDLYAYRVN